ncbi:MAG: hypothetical protein GY928_24385 [Colwellia sp.]|nr:hypothetical protein [Colwellia sp.]
MRNVFKYIALAGILESFDNIGNGSIYEDINGNRTVKGRSKLALTKKQLKARARSKRAKQARKRQRL